MASYFRKQKSPTKTSSPTTRQLAPPIQSNQNHGLGATSSENHKLIQQIPVMTSQHAITDTTTKSDVRILQASTELYTSSKCNVPLCLCRCHSVRRLHPLQWASGFIGSLFIGYSGISLPFASKATCNEKACRRNEKCLIKVTWYFPSWFPMASRMISIIDKWTPLDGHDISIRLPRIVSSSAEIFIMAQKGNIDGIKQLITNKKASIHDVSATEGRSALHVSSTACSQASIADIGSLHSLQINQK